jgi:AraC-like DNA-binding protein
MHIGNYLMISGSELLKEPELYRKYVKCFEMMSISRFLIKERDRYIQIAKIVELKYDTEIEILADMEILFFNKVLLIDPTVRVLFDNRERDEFTFEFDEGEMQYLKYMGSMIRRYQVNEVYGLGEKFISSMLGNIVLHYNLLLNRSNEKELNVKTYNQERAYKFFGAIVMYHNINKRMSFYADEIMVSKRTLSKITKEVYGKSPKSILDNYIVERAKEYLKRPELTLKEISANLGFSETNNFLAFFKKITKQTPTEFREVFLGSSLY